MNNNLTFTIEDLWKEVGFNPNENQRAAILHTNGPLYLPAGPGSGKTRVLLWRTVNLCVFHNVGLNEIFLSTFTEKAASQLQEGLRLLLGRVTNRTGVSYDISKMYIGTVHSLCQRLIMDRNFYPNRQRKDIPSLMDDLSQYFYLARSRMWDTLTSRVGLDNQNINGLFDNQSSSKYVAVSNCIQLFNRFSEECIEPGAVNHRTVDPVLSSLLEMYQLYRESLERTNSIPLTDFSLLQQWAMQVLEAHQGTNAIFKHVIVDEYQDTNTIQERIFFHLVGTHKNICVVGDDDQALYRFRGATVENFVQFPSRCQSYLQQEPTRVPLSINYRSRKRIVDFYTRFMTYCNWQSTTDSTTSYRVTDKNIQAHSTDNGPSVIASIPGQPLNVCAEIANFVRTLLDTGKVHNENQIAFLFPSLKSTHVGRMKEALEAVDLRVYAPRAGRFLEVEESIDLFGIYLHIFGKPDRGTFRGQDYNDFYNWLDKAYQRGKDLLNADGQLAAYVEQSHNEIETAARDYRSLIKVTEQNQWNTHSPYDIDTMKRLLSNAFGLSKQARKTIESGHFEKIVKQRITEGKPFSLGYIINRATSPDWSVLDLFYRVCGFDHFREMFDLAERGVDEGSICNMGLISQYLARFVDEYTSILTGELLNDNGFQRLFFGSYLYALFRRGESEFEDAEDPFPRGRIPFLTVHQSKGLEFPVVILVNLRKDNNGPQTVEKLVHPLLDRRGEPFDRMAEFDIMRMFYVALSRAQNLLVLAHFKGRGQRINEPFKQLLDKSFPRISGFDIQTLPATTPRNDDLSKNYSYTGDYLLYQKCPRQYMIFRKYGFVPSRTQTMVFGSLVHRTMDDLHQYLIARRSNSHETS